MVLSYKRVLLKISGEALMGGQKFGHDHNVIDEISQDIKTVHDKGIEICLVVGGGNIYRGISAAAGMERASADYIGMLATVMNALTLQNVLEQKGVSTRVLSAIPMTTICESYIRRRAVRHMEKNRVVIFAAGTGNPFFTTDTAAALRAVEMGCDAIFKGTQVDGVYSADPKYNTEVIRYSQLHYKDVLTQDLAVMDASAIALAKDNNIPIIVFSIKNKGAFCEVVDGHGDFTIINGVTCG
ncbi:Uridylate kinase [Rickettsiales bacterium Ac37b]|nr:Uridylate kinase [Rickettsiales bacterium Ac37b]